MARSRVPTVEEMKRRLAEQDAGVDPKAIESTDTELIQSLPPPSKSEGKKNYAPEAVRKSMGEILRQRSFDPLDELIRIYREGDLSDKDRAVICKDLMQFVHPKIKQLDVNHEVKGSIKVFLQDFTNAGKVIDVTPKIGKQSDKGERDA